MRYHTEATYSVKEAGNLEQSMVTAEGQRIVCTLNYRCYTDNERYQVIRWTLDGEWVLPVLQNRSIQDRCIIRLNQHAFNAEDLASINEMDRRARAYLAMIGEFVPTAQEFYSE